MAKSSSIREKPSRMDQKKRLSFANLPNRSNSIFDPSKLTIPPAQMQRLANLSPVEEAVESSRYAYSNVRHNNLMRLNSPASSSSISSQLSSNRQSQSGLSVASEPPAAEVVPGQGNAAAKAKFYVS